MEKLIIARQKSDVSTYAFQSELPLLPIPELENSCNTYLRSVKQLLTEEEFTVVQECVERFLKKEGPELQEKLKLYAKDKSSYVETFWHDAYLNAKGSVVLNLNPFFILEDDPTPARNNQIARAASLILSSVKFIRALRSEELEPDVWRKVPLCMHQFTYLFGCSRRPELEKDQVVVDKDSKHIVVLCRNQFYWFDVIWENGNAAIKETELIENLKNIKLDAKERSAEEVAMNAVGVLTAEKRKTWCMYRKKLLLDNEENLKMIDTALFLVCLDHTSPPTASEFAATALHGTYMVEDGVQTGTCINRWYDKLQLIICENGIAGVNFEHSTVDGHTVLRYVSDIFTDTIIRFAQTIRGKTHSLFEANYCPIGSSEDPKKPDISPRKLEWVLKPDVINGIRFAEARLSDLIVQNDVQVLEFHEYGKLFIVEHNLSPDAFMQMAFIASYYSLYGNNINVYEPVLTKQFFHGRTEAARSMTAEAAAYAILFCSDATPEEKIIALRSAIHAQVALVKKCSSGQGADRHLYSLQCIATMDSEQNLPEFFRNVGWEAYNNTILSTSNCGNPSLRLFGFGPVVGNGFGIGYIIKDEAIQCCVSSKHRQTQRFVDTLNTYLLDLRDLLTQESASLSKENKNRRSLTSLATAAKGLFASDDSMPSRAGHKI